MELKLSLRKRENTRLGFLLVLFRRMVALVLLGFAVLYWMKIVGLSPDTNMRFDTMSEPWRVASSVLAVILPVAAIGLWGLFPWGTSIWLVAITFELSLFLGLPQVFGDGGYVVYFHVAALATYIVIKLLMMITRRRRVLPRRQSTA